MSYTTVGLTIHLLVNTFPSRVLAPGNGAVTNIYIQVTVWTYLFIILRGRIVTPF